MDADVPRWTIAAFAAAFWLLQRVLRRSVRLWALLTLPATVLHESAHALVGLLSAARPSSWSLWPRRVGATSWRLGYVGFTNLRWWNGGAVALAPLGWALALVALYRYAPIATMVPTALPLGASLFCGAGLVWVGIAVAPGRSDWLLAGRHWPSALAFLAAWAAIFVILVTTPHPL